MMLEFAIALAIVGLAVAVVLLVIDEFI